MPLSKIGQLPVTVVNQPFETSPKLELNWLLSHSPPPLALTFGNQLPIATWTCSIWFKTFARCCFQEWPIAFARLDRRQQIDFPRDVSQISG